MIFIGGGKDANWTTYIIRNEGWCWGDICIADDASVHLFSQSTYCMRYPQRINTCTFIKIKGTMSVTKDFPKQGLKYAIQ